MEISMERRRTDSRPRAYLLHDDFGGFLQLLDPPSLQPRRRPRRPRPQGLLRHRRGRRGLGLSRNGLLFSLHSVAVDTSEEKLGERMPASLMRRDSRPEKVFVAWWIGGKNFIGVHASFVMIVTLTQHSMQLAWN